MAQIIPAPKLGVQSIERCYHLGAGAVHRPHALPRRDCIFVATEFLCQHRCTTPQGLLRFRVLRQVCPPQDDLVQLLVFTALFVDGFESRERAVVVGTSLDDAIEVIARHHEVT